MRDFFKDYNIINFPGGQHRRADGRLVPQGDQDGRRPEGPQDAHRRLRAAPCSQKLGVGAAADSRAATSIPRWRRARSTRRNGSVRTTTRSSASTRSPSTTTTPAGGKAVPSSTCSSTTRRATKLPKEYQSILEAACYEANVDMMAKYDAVNPPALQRLLANGVKLRRSPTEIMAACYKAADRGVRRNDREEREVQEDLRAVEEVPRRGDPLVQRRRKAASTTS